MHFDNKVVKGLIWKLLERFSVYGIQFVLQIILARLLDPKHYGMLSIMIVFITIANVFIQNGFNTALIQNKDVTEDDYSSVLWGSMAVACVLYIIIYCAAPMIGRAYKSPEIIVPLRVLAVVLFPGAFNSIQLAKISRIMEFRKVFISNFIGVLVSGFIGVVIAYKGGGIWALVAQNVINVVVVCFVMMFTVKLQIKLVFNIKRIKILFSYGWKLLVSSILDTIDQDIRSLIIGLKFNTSMLGFFDKGKQFPQYGMNVINGAVQSVMLPAMSEKQAEKKSVKELARSSVSLCSFFVFPLMAGLAGVSTSLVSLLLTDKWLACVPYIKIYCFIFAFYPVHTSNLQAINAVGRSDIFLKLELIKKSYSILLLVITIVLFNSPLAIAATGIITTFVSFAVNASPNRKLINYSILEQIGDVLPSLVCSFSMFILVWIIEKIGFSPMKTIVIQVPVGVLIYILLSLLVKSKPLFYVLRVIKKSLS